MNRHTAERFHFNYFFQRKEGMQNSSGQRVLELQGRLADEQIDMALIQDPDSIFYLARFWCHLGMEFGRPTILIVPRSGPPTLVTPGMEAEMATNMTWVEDIREWTDGMAANGRLFWMICMKLQAIERSGLKIINSIRLFLTG
jgi:Xaa-Pro aminopeptidase